MFGIPLAFAAPAVLFGLIALPVIWWLLRMTPPRPREEVFPPLRILAAILKREETPSKSPWWLTLLRLLIAGLVIVALAEPILNPRENRLSPDGPVAILMDNGWASAPDWDDRVEAAEALLDDAEAADIPVSLVFSAEQNHEATPGTAASARDRLRAIAPRPIRPDRAVAAAALATGFGSARPATLVILSDGIAAAGDEAAAETLSELSPGVVRLVEPEPDNAVALTGAENAADGFEISATRLPEPAARDVALAAFDIRGREIAGGRLRFEPGSGIGTGVIEAPFELRNDFARLAVREVPTAGASFLLNDSFRRRRVALLSGEPLDLAQPLLSPLYYIERALEPFADLVRPREADLAEAIPELLAERPSVLVMADIGTLPDEAYEPLVAWIEDGGMLLRFAGPRLAGAAADDPLVPVTLRQGERALGGSLSWTEPQPLADFPPESPFAGMPRPESVTVTRQVLAEPSPDLAERTWASLADGTPLVTTRERGDGRIVLFHVTASATWSNLPISGDFVNMLRRTIQLSSARGASADPSAGGAQSLPPYRMLGADGLLVQPPGGTQPLRIEAGVEPGTSFENPPGLYGSEDGFRALNLMRAGETLAPFTLASLGAPVTREVFSPDEAEAVKPWLFAAATALLLLDTLVVLFLGGAFSRIGRRPATATAGLLLIATALFSAPADKAFAQTVPPAPGADAQPIDPDYLERLDRTHLAYVITGDAALDDVTERGLKGLTEFLTYRTSLEPGDPVGLDIETDQLSFYPMIYWSISATAPLPSSAAISRIDAYMKNGGTVLFDTRDELSGLNGRGAVTPETQKLRTVLADLDIPPLEPVPQDHVLTKSFYLLNDFPGRYRGSPLWVEALPEDRGETSRPARAGDGVSSIIITGNDLAGAWAVDDGGLPMFSTVPPDPVQREHAFRVGVNVMMYMLTGNYKADQVHIPALLERLGQ